MTHQRQSAAILALGILFLGTACSWGGEDAKKYVGSDKCKNCHSAAVKGAPYDCWAKTKHAQAYQTLASEEAKKAGAAKNINNPQQNDACLRCHVTAFGVPADQKGKKFDQTQGVQCESCHGPGSKHVEARLAAEEGDPSKVIQVGAGEIIHQPTQATCKTCHNPESPSYKPFCFKKYAKLIAHLDPRRNHPANYFDTLPCDCDECKKAK
jgi:hypothetical protein